MNYLAGGTNSPIPIPKYYPANIIKGEGPYVIDKNGKRYIDMWMGYGALLFGHTDPDITKKICSFSKNGWFFSYQTNIEKKLSEILHKIIPCAERVRFAATGSGAVSYAIRASRAYTKRRKILSVIGGYHGVHEGMTPSKGVASNIKLDLIPFNDAKRAEQFLLTKKYACFLLEPILANSGCTPPTKDYLSKIRKFCSNTGTVLIFDEIVTGFRINLGGAQSEYKVTPDMATFSKAIACGLPLSVIAGKKDIMNEFIPVGEVFFAGTFNGNPLSLAVAINVIEKLKKENLYSQNNKIGEYVRERINAEIKKNKLKACVQGVSSMFTIAFGCNDFNQGIKIIGCDKKAYNFFIEKLAEKKILFPPLPTETVFLSPVHNNVLGQIINGIKYSLREVKKFKNNE